MTVRARVAAAAITALASTLVSASPSPAQVRPLTFQISGLIDQAATYTQNISAYDLNVGRNADKQFYGRTRGRLDFIGEVGRARGVLGVEIDSYYGQTGFSNSNLPGATPCLVDTHASVTCGAAGTGADGSFSLNTDVQAAIQVKWLYTEFEVPLVPVPTVLRAGAQPFGAAATYKLATFANGDFAGVNVTAMPSPYIRLLGTYVAVEELLTGKRDITAIPLGSDPRGPNVPQSRGDDFALIAAAEINLLRGLDIKPVYSYFYANGVTSPAARQGRGGFAATTALTASSGIRLDSPFAPMVVAGADGVGTGVHENRHTIGLDARWRIGRFLLDPTVLYQFGDRNAFNTMTPAYGIVCNSSGTASLNCRENTARLDAWLLDIRAGYQVGPVLLQGLFMYTTGNRAQDTLLRRVNFFQPLDTDSSYMADWGTQITSLGIDYYQQLNGGKNQLGLMPGVAIGYDKYGRKQIGLKASYAVAPALTLGFGWTLIWTDRAVDTDGILIENGGILPSFVDRKTGRSAVPRGDATLIGNELTTALTWRFAPGLSLDAAAAYLFAGGALGHRAVAAPYCEAGQAQGCVGPIRTELQVNDVVLGTVRVRFTF